MLGVKNVHIYIRKPNFKLLNKTIKLTNISKYHGKSGVFGYKEIQPMGNKNAEDILQKRIKHGQYLQIVSAYREHGHKIANINPVGIDEISDVPEISFNSFDLSLSDRHDFKDLVHTSESISTVEEAVHFLHKTYCGSLSAEFTYLENFEEREWFAEHFETHSDIKLSKEEKCDLHREMLKSQTIDKFLATKFVSLKRYGGEGAECKMGFYLELFNKVPYCGVRNVIIGAHHRGRLNLLIGLLKMDPRQLFRKLQGKSEYSADISCSGDVVNHLCPCPDLNINGNILKIIMTHLPSHLEAVGPVSLGKTRSFQLLEKEAQYGHDQESKWGESSINIQEHGDAALMGQGVSQESLILSSLPHFNVGGTIHLIINNQLGFTTSPSYGRGTRYSSDIAKVTSAPVIHINGDDPEAVVKATRIAIEYQRKFRKNIFLDLNCYRRWGHNELDDPTFTNPLLYNIINNRRSIPDNYSAKLVEEGILTHNEVESMEKTYMTFLNDSLKAVDSYNPDEQIFVNSWKGFKQAPNGITEWDTGVNKNLLQHIGKKSVQYPESFNIHHHLLKNHISPRLLKINDEKGIDWSIAEAFAFGSLLYEGYNVRISGQDVGRGTFSHRHVMLVDQNTDEIYIPLNNIFEEQTGFIEVANSMLSEEAVLGFEYGFSTISPNNLVIWEAQFGDFCNGAQIQIDTYVTSGESKWMSLSGIVMLLPHGYDGAGPEHSSCRMERFLQLSDSSENHPDGENVNIHIINPTTPAQYFHLLRRQMIRNYRKPLIVVGPKTLLRSPDAQSTLDQMGPSTCFHSVLGDESINDPNSVQKLIFVSGKHYYVLRNHKIQNHIQDTAIIRIEELCPFPVQKIQQQIGKYKNAKEYIWSQEEPQNMGAWTFCKIRFENLVGIKLQYCGRKALAAPAVGIGEIHRKESDYIIEQTFKKM